MGCSAFTRKKSNGSESRHAGSRQLTIKPGTFTRMTSNSYSMHYEELKKLGAGAFADVMLCLHRPTKTERAVKIIHKTSLSDSQKSSEYLLSEFDILRNLDHPNILRCYEIFEDQRFYYIATEYCPGGDLFTELSKLKKISESQAADIMYEVLSALTYCHSQGVVHRDLKPENLFLLEKGETFSIKVADFGSSVLLKNHRKIRGCYGSAYYLAPEVLSDFYDEKSDIWSLGIIMYILLTGRPPYPGKTSETIIENIRSQPFIVTPIKTKQMSTQAADLLGHLLKIKPENRISAQGALQHPWITSHRERICADVEITLQNLKDFNCQSKLQEAVRVFIATQISTHEDLKYFKKSFQKIDSNGDGRLTRDELMAEYSKFMSAEEANKVVSEIIDRLDQDQDGMIDYTEFLVSCSQVQLTVSLDHLEMAFQAFDIDRSGTITLEEIKTILNDGETHDDVIWQSIFQEADINNDGCIDLKEFLTLMNSAKSKLVKT